MAERLAGYDFVQGAGRSSKYPWEEWFDGSVWKLDKETDFPNRNVDSFAAAIYAQAKRRGCKARIAQADGHLIMQAYPDPTPRT